MSLFQKKGGVACRRLATNMSTAQRGVTSQSTNMQGYARANEEEVDADADEDEEWNVYDDFNMTRPAAYRMSTASTRDWDREKASPSQEKRASLLPSDAFGFDVRNADPRRSIVHHDAGARRSAVVSGLGPAHADGTTGIELVTVPALGTEYTKEELKGMTSASRRSRKRSSRSHSWRMWVSGQDHLCGWLSPRVAVFAAFFVLAGLAVLLYFVIPRVPTFAILAAAPVTAVPNGASMNIHRSPSNFSMDMDMNLRADNKASWVSISLTSMQMEVTDLTTSKLVGKGTLPSLHLPGRKQTMFKFPVHYSYVSLNTTGDQTWQDFYTACGPTIQGTTRPTLNLALKISMKISGLVGTKLTYTQIGNVVCPFTLQNDQ